MAFDILVLQRSEISGFQQITNLSFDIMVFAVVFRDFNVREYRIRKCVFKNFSIRCLRLCLSFGITTFVFMINTTYSPSMLFNHKM